ncbi:MAG: NAD-dependent epimerase/dehydratase family protein [bacterium]|nr:NAD-dependent epimerase/dehydratase family protein [bacterium]
MASILITGGAGFIGFHLQKQLQLMHHQVVSFDLLANNHIAGHFRQRFMPNILHGDIQNDFIQELKVQPEIIVHLAAETGISGSFHDPKKYYHTNVNGTFNVLEQCRKNGVKYLIYASSSSVYGPNQAIMHEDSDTSQQLSFYGTTKKMCEVMIENYCKQFGITAIGLRFFTVYGSLTRPDMAAYKFMKAIDIGEEISLNNHGNVFRDFTHVSDVVKSIERIIDKIQLQEIGSAQIFNIGYGEPISVKEFALSIAKNLNKPLAYKSQDLPVFELESTHSYTEKLQQFIHYKPHCGLEEGVKEMTTWFKLNRYE